MANPPAAQPSSTIGNWTEGELATQETTFVASNYTRLLLKRFWTAKVTAVNHVSNPMQVQVVMDGDTNSSGAWFNVAGFTYYPLIGDIVAGCWYDDQQGWVLFPKIEQGRLTSSVYRAAADTIGAGWSLIGMDTTTFDGMGIVYSGSFGGFQIAVPGNYRFSGRVSMNFTGTGNQVSCGVYQNNSLVKQGSEVANTSGGSVIGATVTAVIRCQGKDVVQFAAYSNYGPIGIF